MTPKRDSFAKIIGPNISRVYLRKRLMRSLDNGRKKPLILVHGPAGSGKTTLVASYLKEHKLPSIWYQVDEKDADVANLFFYLKMAKEEAFPEDNTSLPLLTPEYLAGLTTFARRYFEQLYSIPREPCVIVFDNYQEAPFESLFHEILCEGLSIISKEITVILISRKAPHLAHSRFRREEKIKIIDREDLYLTNTESKGVAKVLGSGRLDDKIVEQLNDDDQIEIVYQYHQLFQEFLLARANDVLTPSTLLQLRKRAAALLEESGQILEAGELLIRFKVWEELGQLICRHAETIITQGMNQLLGRWIENIPEEQFEKEPWLIYWQGVAIMSINPSKSIPYYEKSFNAFKKDGNDKSGTIMALSGALEAITHESNEFIYFDAWIEKLDQIKDGFQVSNPGRIEFQVVSGIFYALVIRKPEYHDFDFWKETVLTLLSKSTNPNHRVFIAWPLGGYTIILLATLPM